MYCLNASNGDKLWSFKARGGIISSPTVYGTNCYFGCLGRYLYCVSASLGELKWKFETKDGIISSPLVFLNKVYFGSKDHSLYAVDSETGKLFWSFKTDGSIYSSVAAQNNKIYFGSDDGNIYCLESETGQLLAQFQTGATVRTSPALMGDYLYVGSGDNIFCLDKNTMEEIWRYTEPKMQVTTCTLVSSKVYVGVGSTICCLDSETGEKLSVFQAKGSMCQASIATDRVLVGSLDGNLYCLGDISPEIEIKPENINFGEMSKGEQKSISLTIKNKTEKDQTVILTINKPWLKIDNTAVSLAPDEEKTITASIDWEKITDVGMQRASIKLVWGSSQSIVLAKAYVLYELDSEFKGCGWGNSKANAQRTGSTGAECGPLTDSVAKIWSTGFGQPFGNSPCVVGDWIIAGPTWGKTVSCLLIENGSVAWNTELDKYITSSPSATMDYTIIGAQEMLYCMDTESGKKLWEFQTGADILSNPMIIDDRVFFGSKDNFVYCLAVNTGKLLWKSDELSPIVTSGTICMNRICFGGSDGKLYCLATESGSILWTFTAKGEIATAAYEANKLFFATREKMVYCIEVTTGKRVWVYEAKSQIQSSPSISEGQVYFGSNDGSVTCLAQSDGKKKWEFVTGNYVTASPSIYGKKVIVPSQDKNIYCLDSLTGEKIWSFKCQDSIKSEAVIYKGNIIFGSYDKQIYCLSDTKETLTIEPKKVDFGSVQSYDLYGSPDPIMLEVGNTSGEEMIVELSTASTWFVLSNKTLVIAPKSKYIVKIGLSTDGITDQGNYWGQIKLKSGNYEDQIDVRAYISGEDQGEEASGCEWICFKRNPGRTGFEFDGCAPAATELVKIFSVKMRDMVESSPATYDGRLFVGCMDGNLYCYDAENGKEIWNFETGGPIYSSPAIFEKRIYFGSNDSNVYCVDWEDGSLLWKFEGPSGFQSSPVITGDFDNKPRVYIGCNDGYMYCLDAKTGERIWSYKTAGAVSSSPAISFTKTSGKLSKLDRVIFGSMDGKIYCLDAISGTKYWTYDCKAPVKSTPCIKDDRVYVGCHNGMFYCLNTATGYSMWTYKTGVVNSPSFFGGNIYCATSDSLLICLEGKTGKNLWSYRASGGFMTSPVVCGGKVYLGTLDKKAICIDAGSPEKIWSAVLPEEVISSPIISMGRLYIISEDGTLFCFSETTREVSIEPDNADFGLVEEGREPIMPITLTNRIAKKITVSITKEGDFFSVKPATFEMKSGEKVNFNISIDPQKVQKGPNNGLVKIAWNDRVVVLPVTIMIK